MAAKNHAGPRMGLLRLKCTERLLYGLTFLETAGTSALMLYALLWEVGNLVNLSDRRIGFYNFCLWNDTAGKLQCLDSKHLQAMGISPLEMALARLCVYACLVFSLFHPLLVFNVKSTGQREGWKMILIVLFIKMTMLSGGLGMFLLQTSQWIHPSNFTGGFLALLGAQALLVLQILTATMFLSRDKHTHMYQSPFTEKALPIEI